MMRNMRVCVFLIAITLHGLVQGQTFEDLISFKKINHGLSVPNRELSAALVEKNINSHYTYHDSPAYEKMFKVEMVNSLPNDYQVTFKPVLDGDKTYVRVLVTQDALKDALTLSEIESYAKSINGKTFTSLDGWIESVTNARMQSKTALMSLAEARILSLADFDHYSDLFDTEYNKDALKSYRQDVHAKKIKDEFKKIDIEGKAAIKEQKTKFETRKIVFDELDRSPNQLKDLIAKNDRKGVATLIETYLPWEHLEPVEVKYWKDWLEAVRNPLPIEDRVFLLRGFDAGQVFYDVNNKAYLMPPVIINNQGTYNRRLRSLTTMLDKSISLSPNVEEYGDNIQTQKKISRSSRLTNQFYNHAQDPMGSPHISFTKSIDTASQFADSGKIGVFAIDPRLVTPNLMSGFQSEIEILASMVVFPDENIGLIDNVDDISESSGKKRVEKVIEDAFGDKEKAKTIYKREFSQTNNLANSNKFLNESRKTFFDRMDTISASNCSVHLSP